MKNYSSLISSLLLSASFALPFVVGAQGVVENPLKSDSLLELLTVFLAGVVRLGLIALLLALVWCGFLFVQAQGNEEKIKSARGALLWTVVGGLILVGAEVIKDIIVATIGSIS